MIFYGILVLILASFVIAFFSAKTWHWGHVVLVEAILLATFGFFLLAAETVRINAVQRTEVNKLEKQLADVNADNEGLKNGTSDANILARLRNADPPLKTIPETAESIASIEELDHQLLIATRLRGRVWRDATPAGIDPNTGALRVNVPKPAPSGITPETVVYLFEDGPPQPPAANGTPRGAQFLGEFTIHKDPKDAAQQITLQPVQQLKPTDFEARRLAASRGPWLIYETMPADRYELYAGKTDDQLKQMLPKQSVNEFIRHGQAATADDDPWRKVGVDENGNPLPPDQIGKATKVLYQRLLRDYAAEFDELSRRRINMLADIDAVKKDIAQLTAAEDVAKKLQAFRTAERQKLSTDFDGVKKERQAIEQHLANVQQLLAKARQLLAETLQRNHQLAAELAARQLRPGQPGATSPAKATGPLALRAG